MGKGTGGAGALLLAAALWLAPDARATPKLRHGAAQYRLSLSDSAREQLTDQKRDEVIAQLKRIAAKFDDDSPLKPEMLFQLSEYYWEKSKYLFRTEEARFDEAYRRYDAARGRGAHVTPPQENHSESERYRALTMEIYERLLKSYPRYERRDEVIFSLAFNLYEVGRNAEALARYQELIRRYPRSKFVPDAYIQLGNHYFDHNDLERATANYEKALATRVPKIYSYALYKLAWCDYNAGAFERSLKRLQEVVEFAEGRKEMLDLRNEALNDLVVVYVRLDRPEEAMAYFQAKASSPRKERLVARMANALAEAGRHEPAIRVFKHLLAEDPQAPDAPDWQQAVVRAYNGLRQRAQVKQEVRRLAELYRPGSSWWRANAQRPEVLRNAFDVSEEAMRGVVTEYHQEAQKTGSVETYRLARDIYREYLDAFASSPDERLVSDNAFNMQFYYAEILWTLEDWAGAAQAYEAVVGFHVPARPSAREAANERYRETAAYDAILAYDRLVKIERGELAPSELKDGQKVDETQGKGKVDHGSHLGRMPGPAAGEEPLTPNEQHLVRACDRYTRSFPRPRDEVDIRYQAAVILYNRNHVVDAARRFSEIILRWPEERRSQQAADLTMAALEQRREWQKLNSVARQFLANRRLSRPGTEFTERVQRVVEGSQYKYVDEVLYKREKRPLEAARAFLKFADDFPRSDHADQALTFATLLFQEVHRPDLGIATGERELAEYPRSPLNLKVRYVLAQAYERTAEFRKAAEAYESFVSAWDAARAEAQGGHRAHAPRGAPAVPQAPRKPGALDPGQLVEEAAPWLPDAQFNAALFWAGLGRTDRAVADFRAYAARFPDRRDAPEVAFNVGLLYERDRRWRDAKGAFEAFLEAYPHDSRVAPARRYLATYHLLKAALQLRDARQAAQLEEELTRARGRLPADQRDDPEIVGAYAEARFLMVEPVWRAYADVHLARVSTLKADLMAKEKRLKELERAYLEVLATGAAETGIAALTRIGLAYADLAENIRSSPDPKGLSEEERRMYRAELENVAMPLEDKAVDALDKGLAKAYELNVYSRWTLQAQGQLERLRPGDDERPKGAPLDPGVSFVTATLQTPPGAVGRQP